MDLAFGFLALGGGTIDIGIWKGKDPWYSMEVHDKAIPLCERENRHSRDQVYSSRLENRTLLECDDCYWLHLTSFSRNEKSLSKN